VGAFSCTATSEGGTSSASLTIKRDATLPVIRDCCDPGCEDGIGNRYLGRENEYTVPFIPSA
jgi:hypothetical protein